MIFSNDGGVLFQNAPTQSITAPTDRAVESFNIPVISLSQETQRELCSLCGVQRPTALSITLTEASVLSVPLWHTPQSTQRMMNAPVAMTSQSQHTSSASASLSFLNSFCPSLALHQALPDFVSLSSNSFLFLLISLFSSITHLHHGNFTVEQNSVTNPGLDTEGALLQKAYTELSTIKFHLLHEHNLKFKNSFPNCSRAANLRYNLQKSIESHQDLQNMYAVVICCIGITKSPGRQVRNVHTTPDQPSTESQPTSQGCFQHNLNLHIFFEKRVGHAYKPGAFGIQISKMHLR